MENFGLLPQHSSWEAEIRRDIENLLRAKIMASFNRGFNDNLFDSAENETMFTSLMKSSDAFSTIKRQYPISKEPSPKNEGPASPRAMTDVAYIASLMKNYGANDQSRRNSSLVRSESVSMIADLVYSRESTKADCSKLDCMHISDCLKSTGSAALDAQLSDVLSSRDWLPNDAARQIDHSLIDTFLRSETSKESPKASGSRKS